MSEEETNGGNEYESESLETESDAASRSSDGDQSEEGPLLHEDVPSYSERSCPPTTNVAKASEVERILREGDQSKVAEEVNLVLRILCRNLVVRKLVLKRHRGKLR